MRPKRADTKWNGVFVDATKVTRPYRAWIKASGKLVQLGRFATPLEAVLAADLARYLAWGPDPRTWYDHGRRRMQNPPNTVPRSSLPFDRQTIMGKLIAHGCVDAVTMAANLAAYDDLAVRLGGAGAV